MNSLVCKLSSAALLLACLAGCANPGTPLPPSLDLAKPPDDLAAARKGNIVTLVWTPPSVTTDRSTFRHPGVTRICRAVNEFPMNSCREVVRELQPAEMPTASGSRRPQQVVFEDVLPQATGGALSLATYAVEVMNQRGRSAGLSNQVLVPLAPVLPPPNGLKFELTAEGVTLAFRGVDANAVSNVPQGVTFRYVLWRRPADKGEFAALQDIRSAGPAAVVVDSNIEWEQTYEYKVTSMTTVATGARTAEQFEGDDSEVIRVFAHDVFPPAQPSGLQAVFSGAGQRPFIDLAWAPNFEPDLAGYDVFRRAPGEAEQKLSSGLLKSPSFRDDQATPGITYTYSVQAVDLRGNRSARSAETSESIPK